MDWSDSSTLTGVAITVAALLGIVVMAGGVVSHGPRRIAILAVVLGATFAFQGMHLVEHGAQLGYWMLHPTAAPWLTPWADEARDGLADLGAWMVPTGREPALGTELLHLAGNTIFFVGILAAVGLMSRETRRASGSMKWLLIFQGVHVLEHVLLTTTLVATGRPRGISTLFGLTEPGTTAIDTYRIWWHFLINPAATGLAFHVTGRLGQLGALNPRRALRPSLARQPGR